MAVLLSLPCLPLMLCGEDGAFDGLECGWDKMVVHVALVYTQRLQLQLEPWHPLFFSFLHIGTGFLSVQPTFTFKLSSTVFAGIISDHS